MGVEDHVGGGADGNQAHQCDKSDGILSQVTEAEAECGQNQGKFTDLCHRQSRQKSGAFAIAHIPHNRHDDQRVADQHEQREDHRRPQLAAQIEDIQ